MPSLSGFRFRTVTLSRKEEKVIDKAIRKQEKAEKKESKVAEKATVPKVPDEKPAEKVQAKADDPARAGIHVVEPPANAVQPGQSLWRFAGGPAQME